MKMAMASMTEGFAHRTAQAKDEVVEEGLLVLITATIQNARPGAAV
jgi:hypothetical protein